MISERIPIAYFLAFVSLFIGMKFVFANTKAENILDFEAEVIEGEKKRPELFLDIKAGDGDVGSGLYLRPHFDDFFSVDRRRRPRFIRSK